MAGRTLAGGIGLTGDWGLGEDNWKDANDLNLVKLSVLCQCTVLDKVAATPGSPAEGDIHLFDETHATHANAVAAYDEGGWKYMTPEEGWLVYNQDAGYYEKFDGTVWAELATGGGAGVPNGGTTGQVLGKLSDADGDADWIDSVGGPGRSAVKVAGHFTNMHGGVPTTAYANNVASIVRTASGLYTINFTDDLPHEDCVPMLEAKWDTVSGNNAACFVGINRNSDIAPGGFSASAINLRISTDGVGTLGDPDELWVTIIDPKMLTGEGSGTPYKGCLAYNNGTQSIPNAASTAVTWDSESWDTDAIHSTAANTSRFTCPEGMDGKWRFNWSVQFGASATNNRVTFLRKNGGTDANNVIGSATKDNPAAAFGIKVHGSASVELVAGDYIELFIYQDSGGAMNVGSAATSPADCNFLHGEYLSEDTSGPAALFPTNHLPSFPTWVNQGGATKTINSDGTITMTGGLDATDNIRGVFRPLPAAPWHYRIGLVAHLSAVDYQNCGIALRESSSGKMVVFCAYLDNGGSGPLWYIANYNSPTSKNGNVMIPKRVAANGPIYLDIFDDATDRKASFGWDRYAQRLAGYSVGNTSFIVPDQIGLIVNNTNTTIPLDMTVFSWEDLS